VLFRLWVDRRYRGQWEKEEGVLEDIMGGATDRYLNECAEYKEKRILQRLKAKSKTLNYSF